MNYNARIYGNINPLQTCIIYISKYNWVILLNMYTCVQYVYVKYIYMLRTNPVFRKYGNFPALLVEENIRFPSLNYFPGSIGVYNMYNGEGQLIIYFNRCMVFFLELNFLHHTKMQGNENTKKSCLSWQCYSEVFQVWRKVITTLSYLYISQ
jgi:hypothetical protein